MVSSRVPATARTGRSKCVSIGAVRGCLVEVRALSDQDAPERHFSG